MERNSGRVIRQNKPEKITEINQLLVKYAGRELNYVTAFVTNNFETTDEHPCEYCLRFRHHAESCPVRPNTHCQVKTDVRPKEEPPWTKQQQKQQQVKAEPKERPPWTKVKEEPEETRRSVTPPWLSGSSSDSRLRETETAKKTRPGRKRRLELATELEADASLTPWRRT